MGRIAGLCLLAGCASRGSLRTLAYVPPPQAPLQASFELPAAVPAAKPEAAAGAKDWSGQYEVRAGDCLWRISRRLLGKGSSYRRVVELNQIRNADLIHPGDALRLPPFAQAPARLPAPRTAAPPRFVLEKRANRAFSVGEKLTFAVQYFGVTAGYATLTIPEYVRMNGRTCVHVVAEAKTHPFFETFFKVRDRIETFLDMDALVPWRYEKHLNEGGYHADTFFLYDQQNHRLINDRSRSVSVPPEVQDVMSCFYLYRTLPLDVGRSDKIAVAADDMKNYELQTTVVGKERVHVLAGDFDCVVVKPALKFEGLFQQKGDVTIWLTNDDRHIPVMIKSKIIIGTIDIILKDAEWVSPPAS